MYAIERMRTVWFIFDKLRDAQFSGDFDGFGHYLDALIPLARSVTHAIQKEFAHEDGFEEWYSPIQAEMKKDEHFQYFNSKRNIILKEGKSTERVSKFKVDAFYDGNDEARIMLKRHGEKISARLVKKEDETKEINGDVRITYQYYFEDKPETQAFNFIYQYLRKVEDIVSGCKRKFING